MSGADLPIGRRELLRRGLSAAAAATVVASGGVFARAAARRADTPLPQRAFGSTGRTLPRVGLGCYPLGNLADEAVAIAVIERAHELGVRCFDTAPSYANGTSERRVGRALRGVLAGENRAGLWLATKTIERGGAAARRELEQSLARLGVDYLDAVQVHEVHSDWEGLFAKDAVVAALQQAREEGLVRAIGLTCHRHPKYAKAAIERFPFATALVPVNPIDVQLHSFTRDFLPFAAERQVAVVAMKLFAGGQLVDAGRLTARDCLRYALAQPQVDLIVPGCETVAEIEEAVAVAKEATPPSAAELRAIEQRAGAHEGKASEWWKDDADPSER